MTSAVQPVSPDGTAPQGSFSERRIMAAKITRDIDESRLHCKLKAHLKLDPASRAGCAS
jgi:hypothetical protein